MDLAARSQRSAGRLRKLAGVLRRWRARRHEAEALRVLLDKRDERLLDDVGIDRAEGHRLLGEAPLFPGRAWDRWQL